MGESCEALEAEFQALEAARYRVRQSAPPSPVREETRLLQEASDVLAARSSAIDNHDDPRHASRVALRWPPP